MLTSRKKTKNNGKEKEKRLMGDTTTRATNMADIHMIDLKIHLGNSNGKMDRIIKAKNGAQK